MRVPLEASVTLLEATTPVKLPTTQCPPIFIGVRLQITQGWYFNSESSTPGDANSYSPTYPTHAVSKVNTKL